MSLPVDVPPAAHPCINLIYECTAYLSISVNHVDFASGVSSFFSQSVLSFFLPSESNAHF